MKCIPWNADDPGNHKSKEQVHQKDPETCLHVETEKKMEPSKELQGSTLYPGQLPSYTVHFQTRIHRLLKLLASRIFLVAHEHPPRS